MYVVNNDTKKAYNFDKVSRYFVNYITHELQVSSTDDGCNTIYTGASNEDTEAVFDTITDGLCSGKAVVEI
jgi:hypothetical protein